MESEYWVSSFEIKSPNWPGFVEFDDVNGKLLTYSAQNRKFEFHSISEFICSTTLVREMRCGRDTVRRITAPLYRTTTICGEGDGDLRDHDGGGAQREHHEFDLR
ncbi:hypothetical protein EJB05_53242, partial [Eragrostis curvula]